MVYNRLPSPGQARHCDISCAFSALTFAALAVRGLEAAQTLRDPRLHAVAIEAALAMTTLVRAQAAKIRHDWTARQMTDFAELVEKLESPLTAAVIKSLRHRLDTHVVYPYQMLYNGGRIDFGKECA